MTNILLWSALTSMFLLSYIALTVEDKIKFRIPFHRTAVPFDRVTVLIFLPYVLLKEFKKLVYPIKRSLAENC